MVMVREKLRADAHRDRFGRLLVVLVASFLLSGAVGGTGYRILTSLFNLVAIVIAATTTGFPDRVPVRPAVAVLAAFAIAATVLGPLEGDTSHGYGAVCSAIVVAGLLAAVLARVLGHHDVEMQTIAGALCAYLLFGTLFSNIYAAMDLLGPSTIFNQSMAYPDYAYFSLTTLTTTGYGDYTIVTNFGRRVAMLEAVVGPVFLATTVSRLVASARRRDRGESAPVEEA